VVFSAIKFGVVSICIYSMTIQFCVLSLGQTIVYPFVGESTVTRSCSLACNLSEIDAIGSTRLITCCHTDLCNHDGASWLEISYTMLGGLLASFFLFLN
uniref:Snake toxin/toxin-like domain-containing protein n=1 Tax=Laticauda laticaudata TaxID=8630 RepID=A0A8C5SB45_LATLA